MQSGSCAAISLVQRLQKKLSLSGSVEFEVRLIEHMAEFILPRIPKLDFLTPESMADIDDDDIESALVGYVWAHIGEAEDELVALGALPQALAAWFVTFVVDVEVLNGGFNQFFYNSSRKLAPIAPAAFDQVGIPAAGRLVEQAMTLFEEHALTLDRARNERTMEAFMNTYKDEPYGRLDKEYIAREKEWRQIRLDYIRSQAEAFRHPL